MQAAEQSTNGIPNSLIDLVCKCLAETIKIGENSIGRKFTEQEKKDFLAQQKKIMENVLPANVLEECSPLNNKMFSTLGALILKKDKQPGDGNAHA